MMDVLNNFEIYISKGNAGALRFTFTGDDIPPDGTHIIATLRRSLNLTLPPIWTKDLSVLNGVVDISFSKDDTDLNPGIYWWDVCIMYDDGASPYNPFDPSKFVIKEVVSYGGV